MSKQQGASISPEAEAILYFVGLVLIYIAAWSPPQLGTPSIVMTVFSFLGMGAIVAKYELAQLPKPQITTHQAIYSTFALILALAGGYISANYTSVWWEGLALALIGAILAAYEDIGGSVPSTAQATSLAQSPAAVVPA